MSDFKYKFNRQYINKISREDMIQELKRVAEHYYFIRFTRHDFDKVAKTCKGTAVLAEFGSWQNALDSVGMDLKQKKVNRSIISTEELYNEMERIWKSIGHRPSKAEWDFSKPKYSYTTYKQRFGGWTKACLQFIEHKMGSNILSDDEVSSEHRKEKSGNKVNKKIEYNTENMRTIPLGVRLKVLERNNFRCIYCGKSPATDIGVKLHIDHIVPFSKGGKSTLENLQTLCEACNLGKSDKKISLPE